MAVKMHVISHHVVMRVISHHVVMHVIPASFKGDGSFYDGETHTTPSAQVQTLMTEGKVVRQNIIVDAIPSNYGLVTYNGFELTVS